MCTKESVRDSSQSVSWHAYREAERLADPALLADLQILLATSKSKDERKAICFIIGELGKKASDVRCALTLVQQLEKEKDKYVLASVLDALAKVDKPNAVPLSTVFALLSDARWLVRHSAIRALRRASAPAVEQKLIEHLAATTEPYDMAYCHSVLGDVGSPRALPALEVGLSSRKRDVKNSAEEAIRAIKLRFAPSGMQ